MVETVCSCVLDVCKYLAAPIGSIFTCWYDYESNFINLKKEVEKLDAERGEVERKVDAAGKNMEQIKENVQYWQKTVNSLIDESVTLINEKANYRGFDLINRYKYSKEASEKMEAVAKLVEEGRAFGDVSYPTTHEDRRLINKGYVTFESRNSTLNDLKEGLKDAKFDKIGVYGMGGIGKTTLVKEVGKQAKEGKLFDEVVFVEVTDTPDIKKIQGEIADRLGLKFDSETGRADKLYERLKRGEKKDEKTLVILDNIWEDLDLMKIGIPSGADHGGCKLLLTARDLNVLLRMDSTNNFLMPFLNEEEAWGLFKKMAGDVTKIRELQSLQNDVCKECGGLPIAIVTLAKASRDKRHPSHWKEALRQLRRPSSTNFTGYLDKAYATIELSYNCLRGKELKKMFLLCSLMRNEAFILDLLKYVMGLNIFQGIYMMEELRDKVEASIHELKDCCLLLDGHTNEWLSMHDFVREVAISIAHRDEQVFNFRNDSNCKWPGEAALNTCKMIIIRDSTINELPKELECPQLEFFDMNTKIDKSYVEIPDKFFTGMTKLKVLDLTGMRLLSCQSSLHLLANLQTLCLDCSEFEDIAIIGELKELKILSLRGSNFEQLPKEISQLTQLRLLDLSDCQQLKVIAPTVLLRLVRLEELYMGGCSVQWEVEEENVERSNDSARLEELTRLSSLTTLEIDIKDESILPKGLFSKKLKRYKISIGDGSSQFGGWFIYGDSGHGNMSIESFNFYEQRTFNTLKLKLNSTIYSEELQGIFKNVEFLCLDKLQGIKNVLFELDKEGFSELKHFRVHNNPNLLCIVDSTKCVPDDAFPAFPLLESLILFNLIELKKICFGQPTKESFRNLKIIEVKSCVKLKNIFSFSNITQSLSQLERIIVQDCENMKDIFAIEREDNVNNIDEVIDEIKFCQLRFINLDNLPRLASFYLEVKTPSTILQDEHHTPTSLFNEKLVFPKLEDLTLSGVNLEEIWDSQLPTMSSSYPNLKRLRIGNCDKLKYAFSSSLVQSFKQLQQLEISKCSLLKEIVAKGREEEATALFLVEKINHNLEELRFGGILQSSFENLRTLKVWCCDGLLNLVSSSIAKSLMQLEEMEIVRCKVMIEVVANEGDVVEDEILFSKLKKLSLIWLESLTCFYFGNCTLKFPSLEEVFVRECPKMKTFSRGVLSTPCLQGVKRDMFSIEKVWKGDLNTTIQQLYKMNVESSERDLGQPSE